MELVFAELVEYFFFVGIVKECLKRIRGFEFFGFNRVIFFFCVGGR